MPAHNADLAIAIWNAAKPFLGVGVGFALSKLNDWWNTRPRGYVQFDGGKIYFLADDNRCLKSSSSKVSKVMITVDAHIVNRSKNPLSISRPSLRVDDFWREAYDVHGHPVTSDTIPGTTGRDYQWVFICQETSIKIGNDTRYKLEIRSDSRKTLQTEVPAYAIIAAIHEGDPVETYLQKKGW